MTPEALSELRPIFALMKPFSLEEFVMALRLVIRLRQSLPWIEPTEVSKPDLGFASPSNCGTSGTF